jgi:AMMECR1 domain-containing protein
VSASSEDPRFDPVAEDELKDLSYSVDVLMPPEPVDDISELDPERYGVIVSRGFKKGLLLPALEGVKTARHQLDIAMQKAGISPLEADVRIERFEVIRYR